jgi:hypothetical protein
MATPVVLLHGFSNDQALALLRAVKRAAPEAGLDPAGIAFATSTPTNLDWKLGDLVEEVAGEHAYLKANPPAAGPAAGPPAGSS